MRALLIAAIAAAGLLAGCGGDAERAERRDPFTAIERDFERQKSAAERAAPRWEPVAQVRGAGDARRVVSISRGAIQWRVRWECESGSLRVDVRPAPSGPSSARGRCGRERTATFIGTGQRRLAIAASGRWRLTVEQEVDTALREPPLRAIGAGATLLSRGRFYGIERKGRGRARLYRLPNGRLALRFDGFATTANTDLFVWISRAARPRTTRQVLARRYREVAALKATQGDQNYVLPRSLRLRDARSVVIWCEPVRIAYTAAPMRPVSG